MMIGRTNMSEYPWGSIPSNSKPGQYAVRNVDPEGKNPDLDLLWGISPAGNSALLINYREEEWRPDPLPQFASIKVQDSKDDHILAIELVDSNSTEMFYRICLDLIDASIESGVSKTRATCLFRLEKWSALLKRRSQLLSEEEQKGLIAELLTLRDCILPIMDDSSALLGWTGPNNETQDFNYGQTAIEVKSKRKTSQPHVLISSETQLTVSDNEKLFLRVAEINRDANGKGFTLDDIVQSVMDGISDPLQQSHMASKLASVGYFEQDNYEAFTWSLGAVDVYEVQRGFPRIAKDNLDFRIDKVSYRLDLDYCSDFKTDDRAIQSSLRSNDE